MVLASSSSPFLLIPPFPLEIDAINKRMVETELLLSVEEDDVGSSPATTTITTTATIAKVAISIIKSTPAILILLLLNLLDALVYGGILFPSTTRPFPERIGSGGMSYNVLGIVLCLLATGASQISLSIMSSLGPGVTGGVVVENIPFYHSIFVEIATLIEGSSSSSIEILSTSMAILFAITIGTAAMFACLVLFRLDRLIPLFPRTALLGIMGGISLFLLDTGLRTGTTGGGGGGSGIGNTYFDPNTFIAVQVPAFLAVIGCFLLEAKVSERRRSDLACWITPIMCVGIMIFFWSVLYPFSSGRDDCIKRGWLPARPADVTAAAAAAAIVSTAGTKIPNPAIIPVWNYFSFRKVCWSLMVKPSVAVKIACTVAFSLLHIPINVPSYARMTRQTPQMRGELGAQAVSNVASSVFGVLPTYFAFTNSLLFYRAGSQGTRWSGVMLGLSTGLLVVVGGGVFLLKIIYLIPNMLSVFLVWYVAFCLLKEGLWEGRGGRKTVSTVLIVTISLMMVVVKFMWGVIFAILASLAMEFVFLKYYSVFDDDVVVVSLDDDDDDVVAGSGGGSGGSGGSGVDLTNAKDINIQNIQNNIKIEVKLAYHKGYLGILKGGPQVLKHFSFTRIGHNYSYEIIDLRGLCYVDLNLQELFISYVSSICLDAANSSTVSKVFFINPTKELAKQLEQHPNVVVIVDGSWANDLQTMVSPNTLVLAWINDVEAA